MKTISRKKRIRYKQEAISIANSNGINLDHDNWEQIWKILEQYGRTEYLYAIADINNQLIKFGKSVNPGQRFKAVKTGNGNNLKLIAFCKHISPFTEKEVHKRLKKDRVVGEWFKWTIDANEVIQEMRE